MIPLSHTTNSFIHPVTMYLLTRLLPHSLAGDPYHDPKANMFRQDDPKAKKTSDKPFASKVPLAHFSTHYITHPHTHTRTQSSSI